MRRVELIGPNEDLGLNMPLDLEKAVEFRSQNLEVRIATGYGINVIHAAGE